MASGGGDATITIPNYGLDEMSKDKLRVTIAIPGLKAGSFVDLSKFLPKFNRAASNGAVTFEPTEKGFLFEFVGTQQLNGKHYRMRVNDLPGYLDVAKCQIRVENDCVQLILRKRDAGISWLGELGGSLPLAD